MSAAQSYVLSGRSIQLQAAATGLFGASVPDFRPNWRSSNPDIAAVDTAGLVRGLVPGIADIEAQSAGMAGRFRIRVYPLRIEVQPSRLELDMGQKSSATAVALDADGQAIPGMRFQWFAGLPSVASVDASGTLTAVAEGSTTVSAILDIPDFHVSGQTSVLVRKRSGYRITRLVSTALRTRPVYLTTIGDISYVDQNHFAFLGTLSNGAQALMVYENGLLRRLATSGDYLEGAGIILHSINGFSMNARGEVALGVDTVWPPSILYFRGSQLELVPVTDGSCCYCCPTIGPRSLHENGNLAFSLWNGRNSELFMRKANGVVENIVGASRALPANPPFWIPGPSVTPAGNIIFGAAGKWFRWNGNRLEKIYGEGDVLLGRNLRWTNPPIETPTGDTFGRAGGDNFVSIFKFSRGQWTQVVESGRTISSGVESMMVWNIHGLLDAVGDIILFRGDTDKGSGLFRMDQGIASRVVQTGSGADQWWNLFQAFIQPGGDVLVRGSQGSFISKMALLDARRSLLETGQTISGDAPTALQWRDLGAGVNASAPVFRTAGGSLVRVGRDSVQPVVSYGDILPGQRRLVSFDSYAVSRNGSIAFTADTDLGFTLCLLRDGQRSFVTATGQTRLSDQRDLYLHWFWQPTVNDRGQIAIRASFGEFEGILFFSQPGAAPAVVMTRGSSAPGGSTYLSPYELAVDEGGRVIFSTDLNDGSKGIFLWENGRTSRAIRTGDEGPGGVRVTDFYRLQAAGNKFYAFLISDARGQIAQYDGTRWRSIATQGDRLGFGPPIDWFPDALFVAASSGDVAFMAGTPEGIALVVRKADGRDVAVARRYDRSAEGEWLTDLFEGLTFSDSGEIFFATVPAEVAGQHITLFRATPQ